jgi:hypothetical protein
MEAAGPSEMLVMTYQAVLRHILKDSHNFSSTVIMCGSIMIDCATSKHIPSSLMLIS